MKTTKAILHFNILYKENEPVPRLIQHCISTISFRDMDFRRSFYTPEKLKEIIGNRSIRSFLYDLEISESIFDNPDLKLIDFVATTFNDEKGLVNLKINLFTNPILVLGDIHYSGDGILFVYYLTEDNMVKSISIPLYNGIDGLSLELFLSDN